MINLPTLTVAVNTNSQGKASTHRTRHPVDLNHAELLLMFIFRSTKEGLPNDFR